MKWAAPNRIVIKRLTGQFAQRWGPTGSYRQTDYSRADHRRAHHLQINKFASANPDYNRSDHDQADHNQTERGGKCKCLERTDNGRTGNQSDRHRADGAGMLIWH